MGDEWLTSHLKHCTSGKEPWYPLKRSLGGHQSQSGRFGEQKNLFTLQGFEPWTVQPVAQSLYRLRYPGRHSTSEKSEETRRSSLNGVPH
jgi:hypothetical protein